MWNSCSKSLAWHIWWTSYSLWQSVRNSFYELDIADNIEYCPKIVHEYAFDEGLYQSGETQGRIEWSFRVVVPNCVTKSDNNVDIQHHYDHGSKGKSFCTLKNVQTNNLEMNSWQSNAPIEPCVHFAHLRHQKNMNFQQRAMRAPKNEQQKQQH